MFATSINCSIGTIQCNWKGSSDHFKLIHLLDSKFIAFICLSDCFYWLKTPIFIRIIHDPPRLNFFFAPFAFEHEHERYHFVHKNQRTYEPSKKKKNVAKRNKKRKEFPTRKKKSQNIHTQQQHRQYYALKLDHSFSKGLRKSKKIE